MLCILNRAAGGGRCGKLADHWITHLSSHGLDIDVVETKAPGDGTSIARRAYGNGIRRFVGVGGDGTVFEILNGIFPEALGDRTVTLGFLPLGTGNSFLRDFTETGTDYAVGALLDGRTRRTDVLRLRHDDGEHYCINMVGLGFTADVCSLTNRRYKWLGSSAYVAGVATAVIRLKNYRFPMTFSGGAAVDEPSVFVSFCNNKHTGGGMNIAPGAVIDDGLIDVVIAGEIGRAGLLRAFPKIFSGTHVHHPKVRVERTSSVDFDVDRPTDIMIDGEIIRRIPKRLDVIPRALNVCL